MSLRLAVSLLGPPKLELNDAPITADRRKSLALLAYLALHREPHSREFLSALLWPEYEQDKAFTNLRHTLWETQQAIGEGWIISGRETLSLIPESDHSSGRIVWVDSVRFADLVAQSRAQPDVSLRIPLLAESANLYRNHFLTGFHLRDAVQFDEWAHAKAEELRHLLAVALTMLSDDHALLGQVDAAIPPAQRLVALDPLNEESHRHLMRIYLQAGQSNAALKQYQACEKVLRKELGIDPQPETRELYKLIRKGELKSPQPASQKQTPVPLHNLPYQLSRFIGREKELAEIADLIAENRLVTLTGAGGIGKTRLSLKAGERLLNEFPNGVWFIELASVYDPALVPQTIAKLFHIAEQPEESLADKLIRVFRPKTTLLILDNCEHLLDICTQLADTLLKNCQNLKLLTTSREPLGIIGESQYHVLPLALPDIQPILDKLLEYESIQLFEERARLVQENFSLTLENAASIAHICKRLDGIPLAIELAAARVNLLSTEQIAMRLDESFSLLTGGSRSAWPRQQTLRASIDWSWNLLSEPEQVLLRRLSIFAGGWTLSAAEAVCAGNGIEPLEVLDVMTGLAKKSLIISKQEGEFGRRYDMLEMIRQFTHEKLQEVGTEEETRERHLEWMLSWSEDVGKKLSGHGDVAALKTVDLEVENVRSVINWALNSGKAEPAMEIFLSLREYWDGNQPYQESHQWLEKGISHGEQLPRRTLARILCERSALAFRQNDAKSSIDYANKALTLADLLEDRYVAAFALQVLGLAQILRSDYVDAEYSFQKSYALYNDLERINDLIMIVIDHSLAITYQGDLRRANELLETHWNLLDRLNTLKTKAHFLFVVAGVQVALGDLQIATSRLKECLRISLQLNNALFVGNSLILLGGAAIGGNNPVRAAQLYGAGEVVHESIGAVMDPGFRYYYSIFVARTRALLDETTFESAWGEGRNMTMEQAVEYALNEE